MESTWQELKDVVPDERRQQERLRLAYLVASLTPLALDEDDLKQNVMRQFRERAVPTGAD